ncbi:MAG: SIR2 family protein [Candidatus Competibacteraceae bacterium]
MITEMITTNYDCCIEHAFNRSFGCWEASEDREELAVIRNLHQYRLHGGRRHTESSPHRPILHLYKINGCAREYQDYLKGISCIHKAGSYVKPEIAQRIILTERQLQTFRNENWARDLFKDRSRTHSLLFCGFGSDEPQVRHTALNLMDEFRNIPCFDHEEVTPEEIAELPNAPFIAAYERPSFIQIQLLGSFMWAHLDKSCKKQGLAGLMRHP